MRTSKKGHPAVDLSKFGPVKLRRNARTWLASLGRKERDDLRRSAFAASREAFFERVSELAEEHLGRGHSGDHRNTDCGVRLEKPLVVVPCWPSTMTAAERRAWAQFEAGVRKAYDAIGQSVSDFIDDEIETVTGEVAADRREDWVE